MSEFAPSSPRSRQVEADAAGTRLDVFLARQPEVGSRSVAKALIRAGLVELGRGRGKAGTMLEAGELVTFRLPEPAPEPPPLPPPPPLRILYEDPHLLVVDKPAGIAVHPPQAKVWRGHDIAHLALARCGQLPTLSGPDRPGIVHRLDRDTSGVLALPRTDEAFHFIKSQFKARTVRKEYRAICFGDPRFDSDYVEKNIALDRRGDRMCVVADGGKDAVTFYEVIERFGAAVHVRCHPRSGRTHQIRVHMASIGHPLVGDALYRRRAREVLPPDAPDPGRHCLHAFSLRLKHPRTHEEVVFEAPVPPDMERLLRWLRRGAWRGD